LLQFTQATRLTTILGLSATGGRLDQMITVRRSMTNIFAIAIAVPFIVGSAAIQAEAKGGGGMVSLSHQSSSSGSTSHVSTPSYHIGHRGYGRGYGGGYNDQGNANAWGGGGGGGIAFENELDRFNRQHDAQMAQTSRTSYVQEYSWPKSNPNAEVEVNACAPRRTSTVADNAGLEANNLISRAEIIP
jgi:hypothetical protein